MTNLIFDKEVETVKADIPRIPTDQPIHDDRGIDVSAGGYQICPPAESVMPIASYPVFILLKSLPDDGWIKDSELKERSEVLQRLTASHFVDLIGELQQCQWIRGKDEIEQIDDQPVIVKSYQRRPDGKKVFEHDLAYYAHRETMGDRVVQAVS